MADSKKREATGIRAETVKTVKETVVRSTTPLKDQAGLAKDVNENVVDLLKQARSE